MAVLLAMALTGCGGSGGFNGSMKSSIGTMQDAITGYNSATPGDVASTGQSCSDAAGKLSKINLPSIASSPRKRRPLVRSLTNALAEARRGFADCAGAGGSDSYTRMAHSAQEIAAANRLLQRARALDS
jgi:hypothetical protein